MRTLTVRRTFTRTDLARALAEQERPDLAEGIYALRMDYSDGGGSALAFDYDDPADLGLFLVIIATLLDQEHPGDGADFAASMRFGLPAHPDPDMIGRSAAYWPGWALAEPTWEQWQDEINDCLVCREGEDHGIDCETHRRAPWDAPALVP